MQYFKYNQILDQQTYESRKMGIYRKIVNVQNHPYRIDRQRLTDNVVCFCFNFLHLMCIVNCAANFLGVLTIFVVCSTNFNSCQIVKKPLKFKRGKLRPPGITCHSMKSANRQKMHFKHCTFSGYKQKHPRLQTRFKKTIYFGYFTKL